MKPFNLFIAVSLVFIFGGFVFLKDGFSTVQSKSQPSNELNFDMVNYLNYSESALDASQKWGKAVLFFAATTWCQSCSELEREIVASANQIPSNVTILKVDYDNDKSMNQKYGVTSQHTLVVLDQNGEEVKRWLGGDFNNLISELKRI